MAMSKVIKDQVKDGQEIQDTEEADPGLLFILGSPTECNCCLSLSSVRNINPCLGQGKKDFKSFLRFLLFCYIARIDRR